MTYKLKDNKTGSYASEYFTNSLKLLVSVESLNIFDYTVLSDIEKMIEKALKFQFKSILQEQASYDLTYDFYNGKVYNNEVCLQCGLRLLDKKLIVHCENILKVENKNPEYRLSLNYIEAIQNEIETVVEFINNNIETVLNTIDNA